MLRGRGHRLSCQLLETEVMVSQLLETEVMVSQHLWFPRFVEADSLLIARVALTGLQHCDCELQPVPGFRMQVLSCWCFTPCFNDGFCPWNVRLAVRKFRLQTKEKAIYLQEIV